MSNNSSKKQIGLIYGLVIGAIIGAVIGVITQKPLLWIPVGSALGMAVGAAFDEMNKRK